MAENSTTDAGRQRRLASALALLALVGLLAAQILAILHLNGGRFVYTLDDAYIQLAMAEGIAAGTYGINGGETAAASSSIAYPFLLAPLARTGVAEWLPLGICVAAAVATVLAFVALAFTSFGFARRPVGGLFAAALAILLMLSTNLVGLALSGMEHSLQVLLTALAVLGVARLLTRRVCPPWLPIVLAAGPLVRYENLALSLPLLALLAWRGYWRQAAIAVLGMALVIGGFTAFLHSEDLGPLPASVMIKSTVAGGGGVMAVPKMMARNLKNNLSKRQGAVLGLAALLLAAASFGPRGDSMPFDERLFGGALAAAGGAHLAFGELGSYSRYEIYAWVALLLGGVFLGRRFWGSAWGKGRAWHALAACGPVLLLAALPYVLVLETIPGAASNIYEQQHQMHRFVVDHYRGPVAVNDIGWVAFRNDGYVLDLWGLASREAAEARARGGDVAWMEDLAAAHGVGLIMIYDLWFPEHPPGWTRVGTLRLSRERVSSAGADVAFYVRGDAARAKLEAALPAFVDQLPAGVAFLRAPGG
ncbi:MAG: hypothetical protein AAGD06_04525 [Acidobacteriota bacterium]